VTTKNSHDVIVLQLAPMAEINANIASTRVALNSLICPITQQFLFDPAMLTPCGHLIEKECCDNLRSCPCCQQRVAEIMHPAPPLVQDILLNTYTLHPELYRECHFNIQHLVDVLEHKELKSPKGLRIINMLQHAGNHLNNLVKTGIHIGKSAASILTSYPEGRQLLQHDKKMNRLITDETKKMIVADKSIADWLSILEKDKANDCRFFKSSPTQKTNELLHHVMNGNVVALKKTLASIKNASTAILDKTHGKEQNGREWQSISPLQFAAWAGDITDDDEYDGMVNVLLQFIPDANKQEALNQLIGVRDIGTENGPFLSPYKKLIEDHITYKINFERWNWAQRDDYWVKVIGLAQKQLPIIGIQEMCDPNPHYPKPIFKHATPRSCQLWNKKTLSVDATSGLSTTLALYQGPVRLPGIPRELRGAIPSSRGTVVDTTPLIRTCDDKMEFLNKKIRMLQLQLNPADCSFSPTY
jgi:hypothetical protein